MCDTLCLLGADRTIFAKNSDRPRDEIQVVEAHPRREGGGMLRTTHLEIEDVGAHALLGSRPAWMWGNELGVNEHGVAIGNERVYTLDDPTPAPPALTGMDLVRLGLERGKTAVDAIDAMTTLLEQHGQGGACLESGDAYWSSFLVADANSAWVLETSDRTWAARPVDRGAAISNRLSLGSEWTRASDDLHAGDDFSARIDPTAPAQRAEVRLAATTACLTNGVQSPADVVATLRHHGTGPWGAPGSDPGHVEPVPAPEEAEQDRPTVCWHDYTTLATTASMVAELRPTNDRSGTQAWVALGSPCASVYMPVFAPHAVPAAFADPSTWLRFACVRDRVESETTALSKVRTVLGPIEAELWDRARDVPDDPDDPDDPDQQRAFVEWDGARSTPGWSASARNTTRFGTDGVQPRGSVGEGRRHGA
jgi:secernin